MIASELTTLTFQGVEITLPLDVPFSYAADNLVLDFSAGFRGKLNLRRVIHPQGLRDSQEDLPIPLNASLSEGVHILEHNSLEADALDELDIIPDTGASSPVLDPAPLQDNHPCDIVVKGACNGTPPLQSDEVGPLKLLPCALAVDESIGELCKTAVKSKAQDKENITPPLAAPRRGSRVSTGKRTRGSDVPRIGNKAQKGQLLDPEWEFRWVLLTNSITEGAEANPKPAARWGSSLATTSSGQVILFGGATHEGQLGDTWHLDLQQQRWDLVNEQQKDSRAWHSLALTTSPEGERLLLYGGEREVLHMEDSLESQDQDEVDCVPLSDVALLDPALNLWVPITLAGPEGKSLPPRSGHSLTSLKDGRVLLFGGVDDSGKFRNDAYLLDARRMAWMGLAGISRGAPPKPRAYHTATMVGDRIIVLGGLNQSRPWSFKEVYSLSPESWAWKEHTSEVQGDVPTPRSGHSTVALPGGRYLLLFGGGDSNDAVYLSSAHILDTLTWHWTQLSPKGHERPLGRLGHSMVITEQNGNPMIIVHGGRAQEDTLLDDTWCLELTPNTLKDLNP